MKKSVMEKSRGYVNKITYVMVTLLFSSLVVDSVFAANERLGKTILARGKITADRVGKPNKLKRLSPIFRQDVLRSGANARAQFRMIDNALINLQQKSILRLRTYQLSSNKQDGSVLMELISGGLRTITGTIGKKNKEDYQLRTPVATIGIRGTMYEVEIMPKGGMYVGTWQGAIWIRSHSGRCDIELGDGFQNRFVYITPQGVCQVLKEIPVVFREGHSSTTRRSSIQPEYQIEPLLENPQQEQSFQALTVGQGTVALARGRTNTMTRSTPVISTNNNGVVSSTIGSVSSFSQNIGGYPVGWGRWNAYSIRPELEGASTAARDKNGLIWSTYKATDSDVIASREGHVSYDHMVDSLVQSNMGNVSKLAVQMDVDFGSGVVSNGAISAQVPNHTWVGVFDGQVTKGKLALGFNGGSLVNAMTGVSTQTRGHITGDFVGSTGKAITGGFSMVDEASDHQIEGVFVVEQE